VDRFVTLLLERGLLCAAQRLCNQRKVVWSMRVKPHILIPIEVQSTDA
jgi:hypothetical protein